MQNKTYKNKLTPLENFVHNRIIQHNDKDTAVHQYQKAIIMQRLIAGKQNKLGYLEDIQHFGWWNRKLRIMKPSQLDYKFIKLPKLLWPLYFIIRPYRVAVKELSKSIKKS